MTPTPPVQEGAHAATDEDIVASTRKSPKQWATIYRQVTGACQWGTQDFMARRKLKKSYTLAEILRETEGAFGHEAFKGVVAP